MLKIISWNQYFLFAGVAAAAWYAYVFLRFSNKTAGPKASSFSTKDRTAVFGSQQTSPAIEAPSHQDLELEAEAPEDWGLVTQTVIQEVKSVIAQAGGERVSDEELVAEVRVVLSNHPELKRTAYGSMVAECIVREGQAVGFDWTEEEVDSFWD